MTAKPKSGINRGGGGGGGGGGRSGKSSMSDLEKRITSTNDRKEIVSALTKAKLTTKQLQGLAKKHNIYIASGSNKTSMINTLANSLGFSYSHRTGNLENMWD